MIEIKPTMPFSISSTGSTGNRNGCFATKPSTKTGLIPGVIRFGDEHVASTLRIGNHVDALPYSSSTTSYQQPHGTFTCLTLQTRSANPPSVNDKCDGKNLITRHEWTVPVESLPWEYFLPGQIPSVFEEIVVPKQELEFARIMAETKAKNHIRRGLTNLPMMYLERQSTLETIRTKSNAIMDLVINRRNADFSRWTRIKGSKNKKIFAKKAASDHLELVFGILPLIEDLQGLAEYMALPETLFIKAKGKHAYVVENKVVKRPVITTGYLPEPNFSAVTKRLHIYGFQTSLRADVDSEFLTKGRQLGFSPLYNLYDSIPLSFVLSWFSNFGAWLGGLEPLVGTTFRTGSTNAQVRQIVRTTAYGESKSFDVKEEYSIHEIFKRTNGTVSFHASRTSNVRTVLTSEPEGEFKFYNNFSFFSVAASTSLAIQRKLKIPKNQRKINPFRYKGRKTVKNLPPIKWIKP